MKVFVIIIIIFSLAGDYKINVLPLDTQKIYTHILFSRENTWLYAIIVNVKFNVALGPDAIH